MKKNDRVSAYCEDYTYDGMGIVKVDGFPLFVKGLMVKEQADIIVTLVKKHYGYGAIAKLIKTSPQRVTPKCPIAGKCGGCQLQHMSPVHQAEFKQRQSEMTLKRLSGLDLVVHPILTMDHPWDYRNKAQFPFGWEKGRVISGFYRIHSNTIIDTQVCQIQHPLINQVYQIIKALLSTYDKEVALRHLLVKYAFASDEVMVVLIMRERCEAFEQQAVQALRKVSQVKSILCNINQRKDNVILGDEEILLYGAPMIHDRIHDLTFGISMKSFYQVNPIQTKVLYETALRYANLNGTQEVVDLYCGVGTISLLLARHAKHVCGVEIVPEAIANAKENARLNGITNVDFLCMDAAAYAQQIEREGKQVDVVVVDPPRKGCAESVLRAIASMNPHTIVYVSCKVATLARDLKRLDQLGYRALEAQPVDMFPQTYSVECVTLIVKK